MNVNCEYTTNYRVVYSHIITFLFSIIILFTLFLKDNAGNYCYYLYLYVQLYTNVNNGNENT